MAADRSDQDELQKAARQAAFFVAAFGLA